nr:uncharacterized protein LOC131790155 [Pocillopora verrucosa]
MILKQQLGQTIFLSMLVFVISGTWGYRSGLEMMNVTYCGKYDKPPTFKVSPWPSIPTGIHVNSSVTFTPAVDVLETSMSYGLFSDGQVILKGGYDVICDVYPCMCSLPAGETKVCVVSENLPSFPPFLKNRTYKMKVQLFNEENIMFLCFEIVGKLW